MSENIHTLRPGLLVSLSTSIRGNVSYRTLDIEGAHVTETGEQRARWETEKTVTDPIEHAAAVKVRSKVRSLIVGQCAVSAFGLLAPESNAGALKEAIAQARVIVDEFNESATLTRMSVNVITGRIASDDVEAIRAISGELRDLMTEMSEGLKALDVTRVRDAANKARGVGDMLTPDAKGRLDVAITAARKAARQIVKSGDEGAIVIDRFTLSQIDMARNSFLDLDEATEVAAPAMEGRALDMVAGAEAFRAEVNGAMPSDRQIDWS